MSIKCDVCELMTDRPVDIVPTEKIRHICPKCFDQVKAAERERDKSEQEQVCKMFGVKDCNYLSRPRLYRELVQIQSNYQTMCRLYKNSLIDLFCANPDHPYFKSFTEIELAQYRIERVKRIQENNKTAVR